VGSSDPTHAATSEPGLNGASEGGKDPADTPDFIEVPGDSGAGTYQTDPLADVVSAEVESSDVVAQIGVVTVPGATLRLPDVEVRQEFASEYSQPEAPGVLFDQTPALTSRAMGGAAQVFDQYSSLAPGALSVVANPGTVLVQTGVPAGSVPKAASKVGLRKTKVKAIAGKRVSLTVTVASARSAKGGIVIAKIGKKTVAKAVVRSGGTARVTIKAKYLKPGVNKVKIRFGGSECVLGSPTTTVKVVVR
jgi:hypothetical protein